MATSINTTATRNSVAVNSVNINANTTVGGEGKSATASEERKTQRVLETREQWSVVYDHCVKLVVTLVKGEALPEDPRKGFAFGKKLTTEQPHIKSYALGLLNGFTSPKGRKVFAANKYEVLVSDEKRQTIALAIVKQARLAPQDRIEAVLSKAEKKQPRSFCESVLKELGIKVGTPQPKAETKPEPKPKRTTRKATAKGGKGKKATANK